MALRTIDVMGVGAPSDLANFITGGIQSNVAAAGTTLATATPVYGDTVILSSVSSGDNAGIRLRPATSFPTKQLIVNYSAQSGSDTVTIYPPASTGHIATSNAGAAYTLAKGHIAEFTAIAANSYAVTVQKTSV